jgi:hypothetical protein
MKQKIANYTVETLSNGTTHVHYKYTLKDYFYSHIYAFFGTSLFCMGIFLLSIFMQHPFDVGLIIVYFGLIILTGIGITIIVNSFETFKKPLKNIFVIDTEKRMVWARISMSKKMAIAFDDINEFNLWQSNSPIINRIAQRTKITSVDLFHLFITLVNSNKIEIHQFEKPYLFISSDENKRTEERKMQSITIAELLANRCQKNFYWKGLMKK